MKKYFLVAMEYEETTECLFTEMGVEVTFDNQLYELKQNGHVSSFGDTEAYEIEGEKAKEIIKNQMKK